MGEGLNARPMRWSRPGSELVLPVLPGKEYEIAIDLNMPKQAESPEAGVYLDGKRLAPLQAGGAIVRAQVPPSASDTITLQLRCRGWVPKDTVPGSIDNRTLGICVYSVTVRAKDAGPKLFDANKGDWGD
jgi:hypothetical protein